MTEPQTRKKRRTSGQRTTPAVPSSQRKRGVKSVLEVAPTIVVGMDFGTTYSGFAFALASEIQKVYGMYEWPDQSAAGGKPYCKTETLLRYKSGGKQGEFQLLDWGCTGSVNHYKALQNSRSSGKDADSYLIKMFKLDLAPSSSASSFGTSQAPLPGELTVERTVSDYLHSMSVFVMEQLRMKLGDQARKKDVQWCLTVPAMWDDRAKQQMIRCAEKAGLVKGPSCQDDLASPHPLVIVIEPEAASVYCQSKFNDIYIGKGSKFLVVDAGGGTVDLVVHEKVDSSGVRMKEVACSSGRLCGGSFINRGFHNFFAGKIGCYELILEKFPAIYFWVQDFIEGVKCNYDGESSSDRYFDLPAKLATAWQEHDKENQTLRNEDYYDEIPISAEDMKNIFDEVVDQILEMITDQFIVVPDLEAIMVVGGFSNSPYLMKRIQSEFSSRVKHILNPPDPGSAVCQGAVAFGAIDADVMLSRKSRKTYGLSISRQFRLGDPTDYVLRENGQFFCKNVFSIFVRKGDDVPVNFEVKHAYDVPRGLTITDLEIYATEDLEPIFVTDSGVEKIGSWTFSIPRKALQMHELPSVEIGMYFGRAKIDVKVVGLNFNSKPTTMRVNFE